MSADIPKFHPTLVCSGSFADETQPMPAPHPDCHLLSEFWPHLQHLLDAGRWGDAVATLRALFARTGWPELQVTLGSLLFERQDYYEAISAWTEVVEPASSRGRLDLLAAVYSNLAAAYRELGDAVLARRFQQQALRYQDDFGAEDLLHLANDAIAGGHFDLAESLLDSVGDLLGDDPRLQAEIYATHGVIALRRGAPRLARRGLLTAYRAHLQMGDEAGAGRDLLNAAEAFQVMHRLPAARRCLREAARHFHNGGLPVWSAEADRRAERLGRMAELAGFDARRN